MESFPKIFACQSSTIEIEGVLKARGVRSMDRFLRARA